MTTNATARCAGWSCRWHERYVTPTHRQWYGCLIRTYVGYSLTCSWLLWPARDHLSVRIRNSSRCWTFVLSCGASPGPPNNYAARTSPSAATVSDSFGGGSSSTKSGCSGIAPVLAACCRYEGNSSSCSKGSSSLHRSVGLYIQGF